ncbi:MAG: DnaA/Hda family protein [Pseudomonadota bacterium]|nr:DnaA/Hda family protein [Pseudomonadota bacterium]
MIEYQQLCLDLRCSGSYSFDSFVGSRHIVDVLKNIVSGSFCNHNIFISSRYCSGKTHLLKATSQWCIDSGASVIYIDMKDIARLSPEIFKGLSGVDLVCLDNINLVAGHVIWEEALFNLFKRMQVVYRPLVLSGNSFPRYIDFVLPDLKTRLCSCLCLELDNLDDAEKIILLKNKAIEMGLNVSDDVLAYIINNSKSDVVSLLECLDFLSTESFTKMQRPTISIVKKYINKI